MEKQIIHLSLNPFTLKDQLNNNLTKSSKMIFIFGFCSGLFDGRIKSSLSEGDRILIIKKDLTIILHDPEGVKPIQWQKPNVGSINFSIIDSKLRMETYRPKTDESFFITFTGEIYQALVFETKIKGDNATVIGDERDFVDYLENNPSVIEPGLKIIKREKETDVGFIDLFAEDRSNNFVIVEVKKQVANPADAYQLQRYVEYFQKQTTQNVRGILVASRIPNKVKQYLKDSNLEDCAISWQDIFPTMKRPSSIPRLRNLQDFF